MSYIVDAINRFFSLGIGWITLAFLAGAFEYHRLHGKAREKRRIFGAFFVTYSLLVFFYTVLARASTGLYNAELRPFWSYYLVPVFPDYKNEIIMNYIMFIPIGLFLPVVYKPKNKYHKALILGFLFSLTIECLQFAFTRGFFEVDDIIGNTFGTGIGCFFCYYYRRLRRIYFDINHQRLRVTFRTKRRNKRIVIVKGHRHKKHHHHHHHSHHYN